MRLNEKLLANLDCPKPQYNRNQLKAGIVHLGIGAFHRAHQAWYTDQALNKFGGDWGIIGCSLRSATVKEQLAPQDGLYTLVERSDTDKQQIIGSVLEVLVGPQNPSAIVEAIASADTKIVSLTVTEKGYCHHPASGELNFDHPDIQADLSALNSNNDQIKSAIGLIVAGLAKRFSSHQEAITLLSCDNLPHNGKVLKNAVLAFAKEFNTELARWIESNVSFPCSMVDRIVPATTEDDIKNLKTSSGYEDPGMVTAEPFSQWVIEDYFANGRPLWEEFGVLFVDEVAPYEDMKLRLLNGSHSLIAYAGYLAGYETVFQVMQDEKFRKLCKRFMESATTTLNAPAGFDIEAYQNQLIERFGNPGLKHRTWQIAMDGSQKVPQRWLAAVKHLLANNASDEQLMPYIIGLAAWLRFCEGVDEVGNKIEISDPCATQYQKLVEQYKDSPADYVKAFLAQDNIFDASLGQNARLTDMLTQVFQKLKIHGVLKPISSFLAE